jgi:sugar-specific transcriptional regulator TrmB
MVVNKKIADSLIKLGFSKYEAIAYCSLLIQNPATAYEIAKESFIPTSKIYEVLSRLLEKEVIIEIIDNNKKRYIPVNPKDFIENHKNSINDITDFLSSSLTSLKKEDDISYIVNIKDYNYLINKATKIISSAKNSLMISIWKEEMKNLEKYLLEFFKYNKQLSIIHFGEPEINIGQIFQHPIEDTLYSEKGGRGLVIVADSHEALMGTIYKDNKVNGAFSSNKGFVMMTEDYLKHDVYIMKIVKRFNKELINKFGENYKLLRNVYSDEEVL